MAWVRSFLFIEGNADHPKAPSPVGRGRPGQTQEAGFSQEKLAEKADLSTVFISRIERGIESPSVDNLVKIARGLDVRVRDLVDRF